MDATGWIDVEGGCRINFRTVSKGIEWDRGIVRRETRRVRRSEDLWKAPPTRNFKETEEHILSLREHIRGAMRRLELAQAW